MYLLGLHMTVLCKIKGMTIVTAVSYFFFVSIIEPFQRRYRVDIDPYNKTKQKFYHKEILNDLANYI